MKKVLNTLLLLFLLSFSGACENNTSDRNPYLLEPQFRIDINLNLPQYNSLNSPGNALYIGGANVGIKGIIVYNQGFGNFIAWEASCPNQIPDTCSTLVVTDGITARCSCEDYLYSVVNGVLLTEPEPGMKPYTLLNYRLTVSGNIITVYN